MVIIFPQKTTRFFKLLILCFMAKGTSSYAQWSFQNTTSCAGTTAAQLTGIVIGSTGSYGGGSSTRDKAFDNDPSTYFDAPTSDGQWVGLDLGNTYNITCIAYGARDGYASRMIGGQFQVSADSAFSNPITLYTLTSGQASSNQYYFISNATNTTSPTQARYVRYLSPNGSNGNVAEIIVYGASATIPTPPTGSAVTLTNNLYTKGYKISKSAQNTDHGIFLTDTSVLISELVTGTSQNGIWPDFVFENDYPLSTLSDLESYVTTYKHLPGIASGKDMDKNPYYSVNGMIEKLLTKVEELTLYVIQQEKEKKRLEEHLNQQKALLKTLTDKINNKE